MIRAPQATPFAAPDSPAAALAALVGGDVVGWSSVRVGDRFITLHAAGPVYVGPTRIGHIRDGVEALAAAFGAVSS